MVYKEETLDPENWDKMKKLGHRMMGDLMEYLETTKSTIQTTHRRNNESSTHTLTRKRGILITCTTFD